MQREPDVCPTFCETRSQIQVFIRFLQLGGPSPNPNFEIFIGLVEPGICFLKESRLMPYLPVLAEEGNKKLDL
jgi:hypothetical protein